MFKSTQIRARSVATIGVAGALVIGGVAAAQNGGSSGGGSSGGGPAGNLHARAHGMPPGPPPMIGPGAKGLTYGELHVQRNGQAEVIRLDQGKITAVDSSSITLAENDGNEVTVALDESTKVLAGPGRDSTVDDLSFGQRVLVCGPEGEAAKTVIVAPKKGQLPKGGPHGGQLPPPPGAQMGS
jgi:hypothetical protein